MDSTEFDNIRWISVHRTEFHHIVVVWLELLLKHRIRGYRADPELVLGIGRLQYIPCVHAGRHWWQASETYWFGRSAWRTIRSRFGLVHSTTHSGLFVQHLRAWSIVDSSDSNVLHRMDGALQFFYFTFWKIQHWRTVFAMGIRFRHVGKFKSRLAHQLSSS